MNKYLTVEEVGGILRIGKTKATEIVNGLPHPDRKKVGKLIVEEPVFLRWLSESMVTGKQAKEVAPPPKPRKRVKVEGLTEDGLIPYRRTKKGA